jgi:16S rRNA (cytosine967-C5)-methyltransferase
MTKEIARPIRKAIATALDAVFREGRLADKIVAFNLRTNRKWGARDRRNFAESVYDISRWWRRLNFEIGQSEFGVDGVAEKTIAPEQIERVLDEYLQRTKGGLALNETWLPQPKQTNPATQLSIPDWLQAQGVEELGELWEPTMAALNRPAPIFLRVNRLKRTVTQAKDNLAKAGIESALVPGVSDALVLSHRKNVFSTDEYKAGAFEVQDGGSQSIAPFLSPKPGERVIDACAGGGGKSLHLAALMQNKGKILALDVREKKLADIKLRARRAGVDCIETRWIESSKVIKRILNTGDRLLLDVPCSGSGVWRRNPDGRWKLQPAEMQRLRALQASILDDYVPIVKVGGTIVYATCSVWPSENQVQIDEFLRRHPGQYALEDVLQISPAHSAFDGFFAARLKRLS